MRRRVLVIDDNRDAADSLGTLLELFGHEVQTRYEGRSALALLDDFVPDVIFLDLGLPGMDGFAVAREIHQRFQEKRPRLVALTGYGTDRDREATREAGFDRHLVKPVEPDELQSLLVDPSFVGSDP